MMVLSFLTRHYLCCWTFKTNLLLKWLQRRCGRLDPICIQFQSNTLIGALTCRTNLVQSQEKFCAFFPQFCVSNQSQASKMQVILYKYSEKCFSLIFFSLYKLNVTFRQFHLLSFTLVEPGHVIVSVVFTKIMRFTMLQIWFYLFIYCPALWHKQFGCH